MTVQEASVDDIVNELAKVLNDPEKVFDNPQHLVRHEDEPFFGWELLLCNMTVDDKGRPIKKESVYYLPVPVYQIVDHRKKMRMAFLAGGRHSLMKYLEKYFKDDTLDRCRAIVMGRYNEFVQQQYSLLNPPK